MFLGYIPVDPGPIIRVRTPFYGRNKINYRSLGICKQLGIRILPCQLRMALDCMGP